MHLVNEEVHCEKGIARKSRTVPAAVKLSFERMKTIATQSHCENGKARNREISQKTCQVY